ncbi:MAG: hypothetical protein ACK55Z_14780, partial [bacterium]
MATSQPVRPSVSGGDIATTAAARRCTPPTNSPRRPMSTLKAAKPKARRGMLALSVPANGLTRTIEPHCVASVRHARPVQP